MKQQMNTQQILESFNSTGIPSTCLQCGSNRITIMSVQTRHSDDESREIYSCLDCQSTENNTIADMDTS